MEWLLGSGAIDGGGDIWLNDFTVNYIAAYIVPYEFHDNVDDESQERFREHMEAWEDAVNLNPDRVSNMLIFGEIHNDPDHSLYDHRFIQFKFDSGRRDGGKVTHIGLPHISNISNNIRFSQVLMGFPSQYQTLNSGITYNGDGLETAQPYIDITNINHHTNYYVTINFDNGAMLDSEGSIVSDNENITFCNSDLQQHLNILLLIESTSNWVIVSNYTNIGTNLFYTTRQIDSRFNLVALHEIGHILGLWHEHQRPDHNEWIKPSGLIVDFEFHYFSIDYSNRYFTDYDTKSIMHYNAYKNYNGLKLNCNNPGNQCWDEIIYHYDGHLLNNENNLIFPNHFLSPKDIEGIKQMYPANVPIWIFQNGGW